MPRIILRNEKNEVIAEFSLPEEWKQQPAPDIIELPGGALLRLYGRQNGVISYTPAVLKKLPAEVLIHGA